MTLLTAREIMDRTCSENVTKALEEINRFLRRLTNDGRGNVDFTDIQIVDIHTTFAEHEEQYFIKTMRDAGWVNVTIRGTLVSFYFPS